MYATSMRRRYFTEGQVVRMNFHKKSVLFHENIQARLPAEARYLTYGVGYPDWNAASVAAHVRVFPEPGAVEPGCDCPEPPGGGGP